MTAGVGTRASERRDGRDLPVRLALAADLTGDPDALARLATRLVGVLAGAEVDASPDEAPDDVVLLVVPAAAVDPGRVARLLPALLDVLAGAGDARLAAVPTGPVTDTLKLVGASGLVEGTADRDGHRAVLTPVAVRRRDLDRAARNPSHGAAPDAATDPVDALLGALHAGGVRLVPVPVP